MKVNSIAKRLALGVATVAASAVLVSGPAFAADKEKDKNKVSKELAPSLKAAQEALQKKQVDMLKQAKSRKEKLGSELPSISKEEAGNLLDKLDSVSPERTTKIPSRLQMTREDAGNLLDALDRHRNEFIERSIVDLLEVVGLFETCARSLRRGEFFSHPLQ